VSHTRYHLEQEASGAATALSSTFG
jgi:hypothetical protein